MSVTTAKIRRAQMKLCVDARSLLSWLLSVTLILISVQLPTLAWSMHDGGINEVSSSYHDHHTLPLLADLISSSTFERGNPDHQGKIEHNYRSSAEGEGHDDRSHQDCQTHAHTCVCVHAVLREDRLSELTATLKSNALGWLLRLYPHDSYNSLFRPPIV